MKNVAVIIESSTQYGRNVMGGISKFAQLHDWHLHYEERGFRSAEPSWLKNWQGDGIITHSLEQTISKTRAAQGMPVIHLCSDDQSAFQQAGVITSDHKAVGRLAAEYFIGKGYQNFAFVGFDNRLYSSVRGEGYVENLDELGLDCISHLMPDRPTKGNSSYQKGVRDFLKALEPPCAVFCANDAIALQVSNLCQGLGIAIPEQFGLLGVDNDSLLCSMAFPSISSVDPDMAQMGWHFAAWLDAWMSAGEPELAKIEQVIPPLGVVSRQSTASSAVEDPLVAKAMQQIRLNACSGATVHEIAKSCNVSRRLLERSFSRELGRTVKGLLIEVQLDRVKLLLTQTDYTLAYIAQQVGMRYSERLNHMFKREMGITPGQFRKNAS